jgi:hypothetical protein
MNAQMWAVVIVGGVLAALVVWGAWCGVELAIREQRRRAREERAQIDRDMASLYARSWEERHGSPEYAARIANASPLVEWTGEQMVCLHAHQVGDFSKSKGFFTRCADCRAEL